MDPGGNLGHAGVNYDAVNKKHAEEINSSQSTLCRTLGTKAFSHLTEGGVFYSSERILNRGNSKKQRLFSLCDRCALGNIVDAMQPAGHKDQAGCLFRQIAGDIS